MHINLLIRNYQPMHSPVTTETQLLFYQQDLYFMVAFHPPWPCTCQLSYCFLWILYHLIRHDFGDLLGPLHAHSCPNHTCIKHKATGTDTRLWFIPILILPETSTPIQISMLQACKYTSMQVCKYASLQVCKLASMHVYNNVNMHVFKYALIQICKYAIMLVSKYTSMQVCKYSNMQLCMYAIMQECKYAMMQV